MMVTSNDDKTIWRKVGQGVDICVPFIYQFVLFTVHEWKNK